MAPFKAEHLNWQEVDDRYRGALKKIEERRLFARMDVLSAVEADAKHAAAATYSALANQQREVEGDYAAWLAANPKPAPKRPEDDA